MKILAIIGSPKGKGHTYHLVQKVEEQMKALDPAVEFEYLMLRDANLELCRGCFRCVMQGEHLCRIVDDRAEIERRMLAADGVVFASPVYLMNVSWTMKNFFDRFAYIGHRPRFHQKKALLVSTTGAVGLGITLLNLYMAVSSWGFQIAGRLGATTEVTPKDPAEAAKMAQKTERKIAGAAQRFYQSLLVPCPQPGLLSLGAYMFQKKVFNTGDETNVDYRYWKDHGWLERSTPYFYPVRIPLLRRLLGSIVARILGSTIPKSA